MIFNFYSLKNKILISLLSITLITNYIHVSNLNDSQAKNYIQNLIDTLFNPNDHSGNYLKSLNDFSYNVKRIILNKVGVYENYLSFNKIYNSDLIYKELILESINFIENCSKKYAKDELGKFYYNNNVNENTIINNVSKNIKQEVSRLVDKLSYLDVGVFSAYYGVNLVNKVHDLIAKELKAYSLQNSKPTYPTNECPVCFDNFNFYVKRIFLSCGHNICSSCLKQWYKEKGPRTTCPMCRAKIDIQELIDKL